MSATGRRLWIGVPGPTLDDAALRTLEFVRPGGVILFRRNVASLDGVAALIDDLRARLGPDLHVAADQEHGLVVRFDADLTVFPGAMALGAAGVREPSLAEHLAEECGRRSGAELAALGVDVNLAPVCDLATRPENPGLGVRSFSRHAKLAGRLAAAWVRGHGAAGVASTLKHFPGLGGASIDSHLDLPSAEVGRLEDLLEPFAAGIAADVACVMSTHCTFPELDGDVPATFSAKIQHGLLRERLGFRGVLVSDDLEMGAMSKRFGFDEVVLRAAAVHDVLCICLDPKLQARAKTLLDAHPEAEPAGATERLNALKKSTVAARAAVVRGPPLLARLRTEAASKAAEAVAGRATTVVRDPGGLLPLSEEAPWLLIVPPLGDVTGVEDPLRGESLGVLRSGAPVGSEIVEAPREPSAADTARIAARARDFRRVVLCTALAKFLPAEAALARALASEHGGLVWIALRSPFDFDVAPPESRATLVTAYGFRPVHQRALLAILLGRVEPYGRLPA